MTHLRLSNKKGVQMKRRAWWEDEWWNEQQKQETIDWLKKETILKELQDKQNIIINAYKCEIAPLKEQIRMLEKQIKQKEEECAKCLVKIQVGDTGWMEILEERNIQKQIQTQTQNEQN